ncbi:MgtC/SapB family protein [Novosphingobium bradum]|uniref:MgtC/SapB family protein n=1 Tax=Novosphingobium bradum TaxID=1737444 RepID=A0ABV7IRI3_9SPHN
MHSDVIVTIGRAELLNLGTALALGLLVGIQRGWVQRKAAPGTRFAGVRTFGLFGLAGGIAGVAQPLAPALAFVVLVAAAALVVLGYWRTSRPDAAPAGAASVSGTSGIAEVLTMACGYLAGSGALAVATVATGAIIAVLSLRGALHRLVRSLDEREMLAIGRFALIALVVLPLLPDTPFGPFGAWRPRQLWLVVVLVSGFSFAGYLAAKWLGPARGLLAMAASGSLVSSTAVTAAMAGRHRAGHDDPDLLNAAIALGSAVMFVRVMLLTAGLAGFALPTLAVAAIPGMAVSLLAAAWLRRRAGPLASAPGPVEVRNPFDLAPALMMMAMVMAFTLAARWVLATWGNRELAVVLAITGTIDVDSAIITMGSLPGGTLSPRMAGLVLVPPVVLNSLFKAGVAVTVGGWRRAWPGAMALLAAVAAAVAGPVVLLMAG